MGREMGKEIRNGDEMGVEREKWVMFCKWVLNSCLIWEVNGGVNRGYGWLMGVWGLWRERRERF